MLIRRFCRAYCILRNYLRSVATLVSYCVSLPLNTKYAIRSTQYPPRLAALALLIALVPACSKQPPLTPEAQFTQGKGLYEAYCASCHEIDPGIGPRLTKKVLATRVSATALFTYTRKNMPYEAGNTLQEDEYWAITAYLLAQHGFIENDVVLGSETAEGLMLE